MELSALGIPLEPVRYIWLIAFIVYIGLCIVPAITHPATISREKAKELYIDRYGSPVNNAMRYAERRSLEGNPLPKHKLRSNLTRARKEIDSVYGISSIEAWFHVLMYVWACLVARSSFRLYTDIAHNGICYRLCCCRSTWCSWVHVQVAAPGVKPAASIRMTRLPGCLKSIAQR